MFRVLKAVFKLNVKQYMQGVSGGMDNISG